jgi:hypothetical protein
MAKFITNSGSYTLVLKPNGTKPIYDHTGKPVRVEGTLYAEFKNVKGTAVGVLDTNDESMIAALRSNANFGKSFTEVKDEDAFKAALVSKDAKQIVKLPKAALMGCNKNELISIAKQYTLALGEEMTKAEIVEKILKLQEMPQPEPAVIRPEASAQVVGVDGGIKKIIQNAGQGV